MSDKEKPRRMLLANPSQGRAERASFCPVCLGIILKKMEYVGPGFNGKNAWLHPDCARSLYQNSRPVPGRPDWVYVDYFELQDPTVKHRFYAEGK